ncbi:DUF6777 domain-containing protein [Streptomyces sp. NPDC007907]|uniref:DUF6777 domain-containing protein n=1 Tax=Streptomyces sp. NPDC007907 TaxID=3364789 RepID=UPI0036E9C554
MQSPSRGRARAGGLGVSSADIPRNVATPTPVSPTSDARIADLGFRDAHAVPFQAPPPTGTAALVNRYGAERVRSACGNPLLPPPAVRSRQWLVRQCVAGGRFAVIMILQAPRVTAAVRGGVMYSVEDLMSMTAQQLRDARLTLQDLQQLNPEQLRLLAPKFDEMTRIREWLPGWQDEASRRLQEYERVREQLWRLHRLPADDPAKSLIPELRRQIEPLKDAWREADRSYQGLREAWGRALESREKFRLASGYAGQAAPTVSEGVAAAEASASQASQAGPRDRLMSLLQRVRQYGGAGIDWLKGWMNKGADKGRQVLSKVADVGRSAWDLLRNPGQWWPALRNTAQSLWNSGKHLLGQMASAVMAALTLGRALLGGLVRALAGFLSGLSWPAILAGLGVAALLTAGGLALSNAGGTPDTAGNGRPPANQEPQGGADATREGVAPPPGPGEPGQPQPGEPGQEPGVPPPGTSEPEPPKPGTALRIKVITTEACPGDETADTKPDSFVRVGEHVIDTGSDGTGRGVVPPGTYTVSATPPVLKINIHPTGEPSRGVSGTNGMTFTAQNSNPRSQSDYEIAVQREAPDCSEPGEEESPRPEVPAPPPSPESEVPAPPSTPSPDSEVPAPSSTPEPEVTAPPPPPEVTPPHT